MTDNSVEIYDTTLRDGAQTEGISYSVQDKILITKKLDDLGIPFVEGGWPGANPKDIAFFKAAGKMRLKHSEIVAFGSTRKSHSKASEDPNLRGLLAARTKTITLFGKSWDLHVREALKTTLDENLRMIEESVRYLCLKERQVFYDAEHFFDGYRANPRYALKTLAAALAGGAQTLVLCDTNGGAVPEDIYRIVKSVVSRFSVRIGIHTHNDCGLALANALSAVRAGARHVQGTMNGYGERCGNPDLTAAIATLQLKLGYTCLPDHYLRALSESAHFVSEVTNLPPAKNQPYVGLSAFAHKGGVHINAVMKNPRTYEHIDPELVGNHRRFLVSELGGKTNITLKARQFLLELKKDSPESKKILEEIQLKEHQGYQYEAAEASFELLMQRLLGRRKKFFRFGKVHVSAENIGSKNPIAKASVSLKVGNKRGSGKACGDGPVNALDKALKKALMPFYPIVTSIQLDDYKVRVVNSEAGTAAKVRVFVEFRDEKSLWTTIGVSENIIDASWEALVEAVEYKLMKISGAAAAPRAPAL